MTRDQVERSRSDPTDAKVKKSPAYRALRYLFPWAFGLVVSGFMLMGIEYASVVILERSGLDALPFMFNLATSEDDPLAMQQEWGQDLVVSYADPHLGFAHDPSANSLLGNEPGFVRYGPDPESDEHLFRIFALGGSTTDPLTPLFLDDPAVDPLSPYNWPKTLQAILASEGVRVEVYNGGVAGYSSSQELLKLIRDVLPYKPDLVIALNGVNDVGFIQSVDETPMVHNYQKRLFLGLQESNRSPILPNMMKLLSSRGGGKKRTVTGVNWGTRVKKSAAANWIENVRTSHAIATEFGIDYVCFLQPMLGFGEYEASDDERAALGRHGKRYLPKLQAFLERAAEDTSNYGYCFDLTDVFEADQNVYLDARHQNQHGVNILAAAIKAQLEESGLIQHQEPRNK